MRGVLTHVSLCFCATTLLLSGSVYCIPWIAESTEFDVVSLDWSTSPTDAVKALSGGARKLTLQGNLDPAVFFSSEAQIRAATRQMVDTFPKGELHIANLGHGMLPDHPLEALRVFVDEVHQYSEKRNKQ